MRAKALNRNAVLVISLVVATMPAVLVAVALAVEGVSSVLCWVALVAALICVPGGVLLLWRHFSSQAEARVLYRQVANSMPAYAVMLGRDLRIRWHNERFRQDFGDKVGLYCYEAFFGAPNPCDACPAKASYRDGAVHEREHTLTTQHGEFKQVTIQSSPVTDRRGKLLGVLEIAVDITHVKEFQEQFALVGQTVAGMAHSIKNIMMGLDGGIYIVNRGLEAHDEKEIREGWDIVLLNFDKISKLVQDILYCSKEREPNLEMVKANDVVKEIYDLYAVTARSFHIDLAMNLDETMGEIVVDPEGLHTVLANLASNAIDACKMDLWEEEKDHEVRLRSRKEADGAAVFEVEDNGAGMEQEVKDRAFQSLFSSKGNQGTGLGLLVTHKIVQEHGGTITFDSAPNRGTTFTVTFPPKGTDEISSRDEP